MPESRGIDLEAAARAARDALAPQAERIDELNVYPVPDGDTGTNMLHTLEAVLEEVSGKPYGSPEEA
ncbi:DAK2 domain-containing protein, partial [Klebsiella pneumoniae]|uniref:DAK2 domain-containing protein n=1 Tax=Klebsiella pneumoniae TaxID=573 RepID=UPI0011285030